MIGKFNSETNEKQNLTNEKKYLALDVTRRGVCTERQNEVAWDALLSTVKHQASKLYNQRITEDNDVRAMFLLQFLKENLNRTVRYLLVRYRKNVATFELLYELYGLPCLDAKLTPLVNQNKWYYARKLAQLQRNHSVWDAVELAKLWKAEERKNKRGVVSYAGVTDYRWQEVVRLGREIITARWEKRVYPASQLSEWERRKSGL